MTTALTLLAIAAVSYPLGYVCGYQVSARAHRKARKN